MNFLETYSTIDQPRFKPLFEWISSFFNPPAESLQIKCSKCSTQLRIKLPFDEQKWGRCPTCLSLVKLKTIVPKTSSFAAASCLAVTMILMGALPFLWPAGRYLSVAGAIFFLVSVGKLATDIAGWERSNRISRVFASTVFKGLRDTSACVAVGLLVICFAQVFLKIIPTMIDEPAMRSLELSVVRQQKFLSDHLKLNWLLVSLAVFLIIQTIWSGLGVSHFKAIRKWAGRTLAVLTVIDEPR